MSRWVEIPLAVLVAAVSIPLILLAIVAIRLDSPGNGLFIQTRLGRNEQPFALWKLRTMKTGTGDRASHEAGSDQITKAGRFLRRSKLDELPQVFNVLRGEMSFVGPRPGLPSQTELRDARRRLGVFALRPGITGLAQVEGIDMSEPERLAARDADYLASRSLGLDLSLLWHTVTGAGRGDAAMR